MYCIKKLTIEIWFIVIIDDTQTQIVHILVFMKLKFSKVFKDQCCSKELYFREKNSFWSSEKQNFLI